MYVFSIFAQVANCSVNVIVIAAQPSKLFIDL